MKECWRWFGPLDAITLCEVAQTGAHGIVTALHEIPYGEVWDVEAIQDRKAMIENDRTLGLAWEVVESLPVHDDIKHGTGNLARLFSNYRQSLANLAACGIRTVCYNFMPVLDWVRTDHASPLRGGGRALAFSAAKMAAFEMHMLGRERAADDYAPEAAIAGTRWYESSSKEERDRLLANIMAGLPGAYERYSVEGLRRELERWQGMTADDLRQNFERFAQEVVPAAEELGMRLCIHPDDPPRSVFGLPRIVSSQADLERLFEKTDSLANGLTFCSGSLGAHPRNDLVATAMRFADRTHFLHLRNVTKRPDGSFAEDAHLEGETDMDALVNVFIEEERRRSSQGRSDRNIPFRPDHGHEIACDLERRTHPGYPLTGRLRGLAELRGLVRARERATLEYRCRALLGELGLASGEEIVVVRPLAGGVAADIARVDVRHAAYCVKFALDKLRVQEEWRVPVRRNRAEYEWLGFAGTIIPESVPTLYGQSETMHGFVMEYLEGEDSYLWKKALLEGASRGEEAASVAGALVRVHSASTKTGFDRSPFENQTDFFAIRLEPYLTFTATRHEPLADRLHALARSHHEAGIALVHGDISPKNILFRSGRPVLLDAECATMGDPSFDVAFCLNHLVIKALHLPATRADLLDAALAFWKAYTPGVDWEDPAEMDTRVCALLPALMLGRVDGKSPVEYLDDAERGRLRSLATALLTDPPARLEELVSFLRQRLRD